CARGRAHVLSHERALRLRRRGGYAARRLVPGLRSPRAPGPTLRPRAHHTFDSLGCRAQRGLVERAAARPRSAANVRLSLVRPIVLGQPAARAVLLRPLPLARIALRGGVRAHGTDPPPRRP